MRVLFLTHRLPYAPNRGDRVRAYHLLRDLSAWADVDLLSLVHDEDEASHAGDLDGLASTVTIVRVSKTRNLFRSLLALPTSTPLTHTMLDGAGLVSEVQRVVREHRPAAVLAYCSGMARLALSPALAAIPLILDMVDVDSAKWAALSGKVSFPRSWIYAREARTLARFEALVSRRASATLVTTSRECDLLHALAPDACVKVVENGVDADSLRPIAPPSALPVVVFCGVMDYEPNVEAAMWLAQEIWPIVRVRQPNARLQIVGARATAGVRALANTHAGIEVTGEVPDVRPFLWGAAVSVAPLRTARGVQNKVLEAVAAGLPTVVTPLVMLGVPPEAQPGCVAAQDATQFANAIVQFLALSPTARRERAAAADLAPLSWPRRLEAVRDIVRQATMRGPST